MVDCERVSLEIFLEGTVRFIFSQVFGQRIPNFGAFYSKDFSPSVFKGILGMTNWVMSVDDLKDRSGTYNLTSSFRYGGALP